MTLILTSNQISSFAKCQLLESADVLQETYAIVNRLSLLTDVRW